MPKILVTYSLTKKTQEMMCESYDQLLNNIYQTFQLKKDLKIMAPRIRDQETFLKFVKEGTEIKISGLSDDRIKKEDKEIKKEEIKTTVQIEKPNEKEKIIQKPTEKIIQKPTETIIQKPAQKPVQKQSQNFVKNIKKVDLPRNKRFIDEQKQYQSQNDDQQQDSFSKQSIKNSSQYDDTINIQKQQMTFGQHLTLLQVLKSKDIRQRGFQYVNYQKNMIEDLHADYLVCPVHLLRIIPDFRNYCKQYKVKPKNPDGLIIQQLNRVFDQIQNEKGNQGVINPVDWISAFITYCADDIQFPYPVYNFDYFFNRLFLSFKEAYLAQNEHKQGGQQQQGQQQAYEEQTDAVPVVNLDPTTTLIGIEFNIKKTDFTRLDEQDDQVNKQVDKKVYKYFLECDLSNPQTKSILQGIKERFKRKNLWRSFYAFDINYSEEVLNISTLPKYLLVHANRVGYPPSVQDWQIVPLKTDKKSTQLVRVQHILDLYDICSPILQQKLKEGRYERDQLFYPYYQDYRFPKFLEELKLRYKSIPCIDLGQYSHLTQIELQYKFLDEILINMSPNSYHDYNHQTMKDAKPTGQYRLIGVILQKGQYFNHDSPTGDFKVLVYKYGRTWLEFNKANIEKITINQVTSSQYWGGQGKWTPVVFLYSQVNMKNMQLQPNPNPKKPNYMQYD